MIDGFLLGWTIFTAIACVLVGGIFFAFSSFVMKALGRLTPDKGIAAMQSINIVAITPVFMTALFGTALACVVLAIAAVASWDEAAAPYLLGGSVLYLLGTIGLTGAYHVPRNNALAAVEHDDPRAVDVWNRYLRQWTAANHVRSAAAIAAGTILTIALRVS